jgi:hypothetical protein
MISIWKFIQSKFFDKKVGPIVTGHLRPGMKVWECNISTGTVTEADIIEITRDNYFTGTCTSKEVKIQPNCMYEVAINGQNAVKKFEKRILENLNKQKS